MPEGSNATEEGLRTTTGIANDARVTDATEASVITEVVDATEEAGTTEEVGATRGVGTTGVMGKELLGMGWFLGKVGLHSSYGRKMVTLAKG